LVDLVGEERDSGNMILRFVAFYEILIYAYQVQIRLLAITFPGGDTIDAPFRTFYEMMKQCRLQTLTTGWYLGTFGIEDEPRRFCTRFNLAHRI